MAAKKNENHDLANQLLDTMERGQGGFVLTGPLCVGKSKEFNGKTYYNFHVGAVPFSMTGKSGEWAEEHDGKLVTVTGAIFPPKDDNGFSCKLYGNNVFPCR
jgi:hypothetical protein